MVHGLKDIFTRTKTKHITISKNKSSIFFGAVYHSTTHVISHPVIAAIFDAIFDVIFSILQRWKQHQHSSQIPQIQPLLKTIRK